MTVLNAAPLPDALEGVLGLIKDGWSTPPPDLPNEGIHVARFQGFEGQWPTLSTIGLSDRALKSRQSGCDLRLELVMPHDERRDLAAIMLFDAAAQLLDSREAVLRGDYLKLTANGLGDWFGIYFTMPIFLSGAHSVEVGEHSVALAWGIPIKRAESRFIDANGWELWEEVLDANFDDLIGFDRSVFVV